MRDGFEDGDGMKQLTVIWGLLLAELLLILPLHASISRDLDFSRQDAQAQSLVSHRGTEFTEAVPPSSLGVFAPLREKESRPTLTALQPTASQPSSDPYGNIIIQSGVAVNACPFRHRARYYDRESWLYYYGHRYYDPSTTKWISKDPKGEAGGWNLTAFCGDDPINNWDALGDTNEPGDFGWEWYSAFIPELEPVFDEPIIPKAPECSITAAPPEPRYVPVLRSPDSMRQEMALRQADMLMPNAAIGTPVGEMLYESQAQMMIGAFAEPGIEMGLARVGQGINWIRGVMRGKSTKTFPLSSVVDVTGLPTSKALIPYKEWPDYDGFLMNVRYKETAHPGQLLSRFGNETGTFVSPAGTPFGARGLPSTYRGKMESLWEVIQPFEMEGGIAAPWMDAEGLGIQFKLPDTLERLEKAGIIRRLF